MIELSCDKMIRSLGIENLEWNRSEITFSRYTQIIDLLTSRARNKLFRVLSVFGCYLWTGRCLTSGKMIKIRPPRCVYNAVCSQNRVISFSVVFRCALLQIKKKKIGSGNNRSEFIVILRMIFTQFHRATMRGQLLIARPIFRFHF